MRSIDIGGAKRLYGVLDRQIERKKLTVEDDPNVKRWFAEVRAREALQRGLALGKDIFKGMPRSGEMRSRECRGTAKCATSSSGSARGCPADQPFRVPSERTDHRGAHPGRRRRAPTPDRSRARGPRRRHLALEILAVIGAPARQGGAVPVLRSERKWPIFLRISQRTRFGRNRKSFAAAYPSLRRKPSSWVSSTGDGVSRGLNG